MKKLRIFALSPQRMAPCVIGCAKSNPTYLYYYIKKAAEIGVATSFYTYI